MSVCVRRIAGHRVSALYGLSLLVVLAAVLTGIGLGRTISRQHAQPPAAAVATKTAVLQDSDWLSESSWRRRRLKKLRNRQNSGRSQNDFNPFATGFGVQPFSPWQYGAVGGGTYRTVCVRLCDGYYFPISASTTSDRFGIDEQACQSRCTGDARLFYYRNSGGSPETMVDRRGNSYADLKTAFLYRTSYKKSCQCQPEPWSNEARQRHAMYATKAWQRRAQRVAKLESRRARSRPRVQARNQPNSTLFGAPVRRYDERSVVTSRQLRSAYGLTPRGIIRPLPGKQYSQYSRTRMQLGRRSKAAKARRSNPRVVRRSRKRWRTNAFGRDD